MKQMFVYSGFSNINGKIDSQPILRKIIGLAVKLPFISYKARLASLIQHFHLRKDTSNYSARHSDNGPNNKIKFSKIKGNTDGY